MHRVGRLRSRWSGIVRRNKHRALFPKKAGIDVQESAKSSSFHADRAVGGDRHHRRARVALAAGRAGGAGGGPAFAVPQQLEADRTGRNELCRHPQVLYAVEHDGARPGQQGRQQQRQLPRDPVGRRLRQHALLGRVPASFRRSANGLQPDQHERTDLLPRHDLQQQQRRDTAPGLSCAQLEPLLRRASAPRRQER